MKRRGPLVLGACAWALLAGCTDPATIAALCPPGCVPLPHDAVCDCSAPASADAGACSATGCSGPAAAGANSCTDPSCTAAGAGASAASCTSGSFALSRKRSDLLVVADDDTTLGFWWPVLAEGFLAFLQEPSSVGMGVGLSRFGGSCNSQDYAQPLVAIEPLPLNLSALQQNFPSGAFMTNSAIPALTSVLPYAERWAGDHPGTRTSVLLITDASPGACDGGSPGGYPAEAERLAGVAYAGSPSVKTYVLGGGGLSLIDGIARAGGTKAYPIAPLDTTNEVLAALHAIRADASSCELALGDGQALAPDSQVVVRMQDGTQLSYAIERGASDCARDVFYVPDETAHYPLIACPSVCAAIADSDQLSLSKACSARR